MPPKVKGLRYYWDGVDEKQHKYSAVHYKLPWFGAKKEN